MRPFFNRQRQQVWWWRRRRRSRAYVCVVTGSWGEVVPVGDLHCFVECRNQSTRLYRSRGVHTYDAAGETKKCPPPKKSRDLSYTRTPSLFSPLLIVFGIAVRTNFFPGQGSLVCIKCVLSHRYTKTNHVLRSIKYALSSTTKP